MIMRFLVGSIVFFDLSSVVCAQAPIASAPAASQPFVTRVEMKSCKSIWRGGSIAFMLSMNGSAQVELERKGVFRDGPREAPIFLPDEPYSRTNTGASNQVSENTATCLAVDADANGSIGDGESWFANLPVRIGDRMYDVVAIDERGRWIDLALSDKPLAGAVVGFSLPAFSYKDADGKPLSNADFRGRPFLIDIWSVT